MASIKVRLEKGVETAGDGREIQEQSSKSSELSTGKIASLSIFGTMALQQGKRIANYAVSNIGNFSGDYVSQRHLQQSLDLLGNVAGIVVGGLALGPAGAIVAAVGVGVNYGLEAISIAQTIKKDNYESAYLKERGGNVYNDGSRGTND